MSSSIIQCICRRREGSSLSCLKRSSTVKKLKKGVFFTLDALFAALLVGSAIVLSSTYFISDVSHPQLAFYSHDIVSALSNIRISEVNDTFIQSMIASGEISDPNSSVIEQIGEFYVLNRTDLAENLSKIVSKDLVPERYGFEILVNDEQIYLRPGHSPEQREVVSSRRMISGIEKFKPLKGATSKVFLEGINKKTFSSYLYFGGFIGQGNITHVLKNLPADANITSVEMELDVAGDFYLYINGDLCIKDGISDSFSSNGLLTVAERWNITHCKDLFDEGLDNDVEVIFDDLLNMSYIAGGFIRVDYLTQELSMQVEEPVITYNFPGIEGVVNLYDAFYVPGTVNNMTIYLHFKSNETSYLTIGGRVIHSWNGSGEQTYNITSHNLSTLEFANLDDDYVLFSNNTIPIRFASYEATVQEVTGGDADVIMITDLSGSMKKAVNSWDLGNSAPTCSNFGSNPNTRRTRAAVCLDMDLIDVVMNYTGNRLWPVYMRDNTVTYYDNPTDVLGIKNSVYSYYNDQGKDKTCLACAINQGYDILKQYSNSSRKKFIIVMTDGTPTHCALGSCTSNSTVYGAQQCEGLCDTSGACSTSDIPLQCSDCTTNDGAAENALYSAQRIRDDLNATIYSIGFGPMDTCILANETLKEIAEIGNGTYQHSSDTATLKLIYQNISYEILEKIDQYAQKVVIVGNLTNSELYPDSYIQVNYDPIAERPVFDEIAVAIEEQKFTSCDTTFDVPQGLRVIDARVTSYSGDHWTSNVSVNGYDIYNIDSYFLNYVRLGDPFFVYVPVNRIANGTNTVFIETADAPENKTGCSTNNTIIYTGLISASVSYADVLPRSDGCTWTIDFEDGSTMVLAVPDTYSGTKTCYYTSALRQYDMNDSVDSAAYQLFYSLDYDDDGELFVNIGQYNLKVNAISVQKIPYPWGPAIAEVRVWKP
jgi:hypothetical protein